MRQESDLLILVVGFMLWLVSHVLCQTALAYFFSIRFGSQYSINDVLVKYYK